MATFEEMFTKLDEKILEGRELMQTLKKYEQLSGVGKLSKKIRQEVRFLEKFKLNPSNLKSEHLQCSNLLHLSATVQALEEADNPVAVMKNFDLQSGRKIICDVTSDGGQRWLKVIARNPLALEKLAFGEQAYGQRSLLDQASDFLEAAYEHPHHFEPPRVVFVFHSGVTENVAKKLLAMGLEVKGDVVSSPASLVEFTSDSEDSAEEEENHVGQHQPTNEAVSAASGDTLNLDITAMIAYVSAVTNGHANFKFEDDIISQQAHCERQRPVKPVLDKIFHGKKLVCCQTAKDDFLTILKTLGGPGEEERANELLSRIQVVPDRCSARLDSLKMGGKVRGRSKVIFGTGDEMKVVTVTANAGFVRAAKSQHMELAVIIHESRALTEGKMKTAVPI